MADVRGDGRQMGQLVRVPHEEHNADAGERGVVQRDAHEEKEEVAVVAPTDAVVEPGAVVVEALHTHMYRDNTDTKYLRATRTYASTTANAVHRRRLLSVLPILCYCTARTEH